ncbi:hypothetical protein VTP01DRAFT_1249 [Rhizomucor pusillus]|uniref:uncharacterized protein n=1 Tax=Rhizomucor pusillus TaxID=4840 RepID=UPI0037444DC8
MKRSMTWSKEGSPAIVTVAKTRAQTTMILGAISDQVQPEASTAVSQEEKARTAKWKKGLFDIMKSKVISKVFLCASCQTVSDAYAAATELAVVHDNRRTG